MLGPIRQRHEFDTFQSGKPFGFLSIYVVGRTVDVAHPGI